jgi:hypothetical protein
LAALPEKLRAELRDAIITLNVEHIAEVIERVGKADAAAGAVLARCAERFAYTAILRAIDARRAKTASDSA